MTARRLVPRLREPRKVATGHDVDVSNVSGEGRGGGNGDEEVALRIMDLSVGEFMVENDALEITEDEECGVLDDKISLTKGKQDHGDQVPRLSACHKIYQGVKVLMSGLIACEDGYLYDSGSLLCSFFFKRAWL